MSNHAQNLSRFLITRHPGIYLYAKMIDMLGHIPVKYLEKMFILPRAVSRPRNRQKL